MKTFTREKVKKLAEDAVERKFSHYTEEGLRKEIESQLEKYKQKIFFHALGLEENWNGGYKARKGSFLDKLFGVDIVGKLEKLTGEILVKIIDDGGITLSKSELNALKKVYHSEYINEVEKIITREANNKANVDALQLFNEYIDSEDKQDV